MSLFFARSSVLVFFLLIATKAIEFFTTRGAWLHPFHVYGVAICLALAAVLLDVRRNGLPSLPRIERAYFGVNAALALWMLASPGGYQDYSFRIAIWPLANLLMGGCLFYFARFMSLGPVMRSAVTAALAIFLGSMLIDLWWPGSLAEWVARPAGFPQNSNNAALLISFLLALLLPARFGQPFGLIAFPFWIGAMPFVCVTLSRSGQLLYACVSLLAVISLWKDKGATRRRQLVPASAIAIVSLAAVMLAPSLREPDSIAIWRSRIGITIADILPFLQKRDCGVATSAADNAVPPPECFGGFDSQTILDESIYMTDDTILQRENAFRFFLDESFKHPLLGVGTGYGYIFKRGPHNAFLSLLLEQGLLAVLLHATSLALLFWIAHRRRAPSLLALAFVGFGDSFFSHTLLIEPWFTVFVGAALGLTAPAPSSLPAPRLLGRLGIETRELAA